MRTIDLVVTDLDGTLWDHNVDVHPDCRAALDVLAREGIPVLVATGRRKASTLRGFERAGLSFPAVTVNGAYGFIPRTAAANEREFHRSPFDVDVALRVLEICRAFGHVPVAYNIDGSAHLSDDATTGASHAETFGDDAIRSTPEHAARLGEVLGFGLVGIEYDNRMLELARALREVGVETDPYREPIYGGWSLLAQPPGVSKWVGVTRFVEFSGLDEPRILAIGDGGNDIELLASAHVSLAVEGGDPAALSVADHLIPPPAEGGWARVLDHL